MAELDKRLLRWLPHRPPMLLLDRAVEVSAEAATAIVSITAESPFYLASLGGVPSCIGLEYMGQTAALSDGWRREQGMVEPTIGFFLGCRSFTAHTDHFALGDSLEVRAWGATFVGDHLVNFSCAIHGASNGSELATGSLSVMLKPVEELSL